MADTRATTPHTFRSCSGMTITIATAPCHREHQYQATEEPCLCIGSEPAENSNGSWRRIRTATKGSRFQTGLQSSFASQAPATGCCATRGTGRWGSDMDAAWLVVGAPFCLLIHSPRSWDKFPVPGQAAKFFRCFFWFRPLLWLLQGTRWCAATELSTPTPIQEHGQQARCWAQDASCKSQRGVVSVWLSSSLRSLTHLSHWCFEMTHPPFPLLPCPA